MSYVSKIKHKGQDGTSTEYDIRDTQANLDIDEEERVRAEIDASIFQKIAEETNTRQYVDAILEEKINSAASATHTHQGLHSTQESEGIIKGIDEKPIGASYFDNGTGSPIYMANVFQGKLISGENLKKINEQSLLGSGNIDATTAEWGKIDGQISAQQDLQIALAGTGHSLRLEFNSNTYTLVAKLVDKSGNVISTSDSIVLPLEALVTNMVYNSAQETITITLKNGVTTTIPAEAIVGNLATESYVDSHHDSTKAEASHSHAISDVTGLVTALAGKASSTHSHTQSDVSGLAEALAGKSASNHVHAISGVTDLQDTLAGKVAEAPTDSKQYVRKNSAWVELDTDDIEGGTVLTIESSNGNIFKHGNVSTELSVIVFHGGTVIETNAQLITAFGSGAYLQWYEKGPTDTDFVIVSRSDSRLSDGGFSFTVSSSDVSSKKVFRCKLNV